MTILPFITTTAPRQVSNAQDVWDFFASKAPNPEKPKEGNPQGWRLQYLTQLSSHFKGAPLSTIWSGEADLLAAFDRVFPKVRQGVHPRGDLGQDIETYKKWRRNCRKTIEIATDAGAEKAELRARQDGWADLLAAIKLHTKDGGILHSGRASTATHLADTARRAGLEPWDLAKDDTLAKLEAAMVHSSDRQTLRNAQKLLRDYGFLPELAALLPKEPVPVFPTLRESDALPDHIEAYLLELVENAAGELDEVSGKDSQVVGDCTKKTWLSALRHHIRTLPHCPTDPDLDYTRPITELGAVNDVSVFFAREHLYASIRRTEAVEHLPGTISQASAYNYYSDILVVLSRNGLLDDATRRVIIKSKFIREGRELAEGMTKANQLWCKNLVQDQTRRRRFRNMHRLLMAKAQEILDSAAKAGRTKLAPAELTKVRQLGTCAAACAIEYAGRPIRMANCLGFQIAGSQQNFLMPGAGRGSTYAFHLRATETKSGKAEQETLLQEELFGPVVMSWYLAKIRPLFPNAKESIYLFPSVQCPGKPLSKNTFDAWFQRAASLVGLPMTFHQWRHGYASLLLSASWDNLGYAAILLGNTPGVCAKNYAWIDEERMLLEGQQRVIDAARADA